MNSLDSIVERAVHDRKNDRVLILYTFYLRTYTLSLSPNLGYQASSSAR